MTNLQYTHLKYFTAGKTITNTLVCDIPNINVIYHIFVHLFVKLEKHFLLQKVFIPGKGTHFAFNLPLKQS